MSSSTRTGTSIEARQLPVHSYDSQADHKLLAKESAHIQSQTLSSLDTGELESFEDMENVNSRA
jgi:hypothetical protein